MELETEFEQYKALHKYTILKAKIMQYYMDLEAAGVNIPCFMQNDNFSKRADRDIKNLILLPDGGKKFNELYELAYKEIAEVLD